MKRVRNRLRAWICRPAGLGLLFCLIPMCLASDGSLARETGQTTAVSALSEPTPTQLSDEGRALFPIVIAGDASDEVKSCAADLATYLKRITGAEFKIESGDGTRGIAIGTAASFPRVRSGITWDANDATVREDYLLRSHPQGVWLLGASDLAARHAVWDFLYRMGYRQFFPGEKWEVVPSVPQLEIGVDSLQHPSFYSRRIWYGYGAWDYAKEPYRRWCERNRCVQGIELRTGHAYDGILARNKAEFAAHPEYLGLLDGQRKSTKFCISNPGLRRLVADDALAQLAADPAQQSVSVDPSDGGGWCECDACAKIGSVTDRAITLANEVASAITAQHPDKFVGLYAYSQHSPPPTIQVHPRVVVSVATAFITGGYSVDELLDGWAKRASLLGIREYFSVNTWDRDLPGAARGSRLEYLRQTIPHFHDKSARFLSAESSDNWGPNGLGYYLASRMLWDVSEAQRVDALRQDFLDSCFGAAREPMAKFYDLLDGSQSRPLCDDLVGRMYRLLDEAYKLTTDPSVTARLDDLTLYTRYVELWLDYSIAKDAARQTAFEQMIRHAYRMRETMMVHTLALYRDVDARDKAVAIPDEARFNVAESRNPWKSSEPFTSDELAATRTAGIARRPLVDFEPVSFSRDLVPATALQLKSNKLGSMGLYSRAPRTYYTWVDRVPGQFSFEVTAGIIYANRGSTRLDIYPAAETEGKSVAHAEVEPSRTPRQIDLSTNLAGLQRIEILAGGGAKATWQPNVPMTIESSFERPGGFHGRWSLYFYVPRGTKVVGGFAEGVGGLRNGSGEQVREFDGKPGYFSVPVTDGEDGCLWKFEHCAGDKMLMTVPPFLARSPAELLLPREVVQRDARP